MKECNKRYEMHAYEKYMKEFIDYTYACNECNPGIAISSIILEIAYGKSCHVITRAHFKNNRYHPHIYDIVRVTRPMKKMALKLFLDHPITKVVLFSSTIIQKVSSVLTMIKDSPQWLARMAKSDDTLLPPWLAKAVTAKRKNKSRKKFMNIKRNKKKGMKRKHT